MKEVPPAHRPQLAGCEESGDRHVAEGASHGTDIVIRLAKQRLSAPVAAEEERAGDVPSRLAAFAVEQLS